MRPAVWLSGVLGFAMVAGLGAATQAVAGVTGPVPWALPAQPGTTPTPGPSPTPDLPPPEIAGDWSVTRTWYRSCPGCGGAVTRSATWRIHQFGHDVSVESGPRGRIVGAPDGGGYLSLEGLESNGPDVYRFVYATLRVRPDGTYFEGGFNGSETISNPCAESPPLVTCSASNGWLTARRLGLPPTPPGPPPPTDLPTPQPLPSATATAPVTATATTTPTATPTPPATPSATATPQPWWSAFLPTVLLDAAEAGP